MVALRRRIRLWRARRLLLSLALTVIASDDRLRGSAGPRR
jgi:hypothetical protein